jgi:ribosome-interacting GTPase 1
MPINASFEFALAQKKYDEAKNDEEKIVALQEMISRAPAHKGGENLRKDLSRKLASLKTKIEKQAAARKRTGNTINIKKEGAGQVLLIGDVNCGKSTFLTEYTNSKPLIDSYPYTTTKPEVGILDYGGALIQLIELPSFLQNHELTPQIYSMIRVTDALVLVIKDGNIKELDNLIAILDAQDVFITKKKPNIQITKSDFPGVSFVNEHYLKVNKEEAIEILKSSGFRAHNIILNQKTTLDDLILLINPRASFISAICVSIPFSKKVSGIKIHKTIPIYDATLKKDVTEKIYEILNKVIVYTKKPGQKVDKTEPLVLDKGNNVLEAARLIHKNIRKNLKSAKVWGSTRYPGQTVSRNYILKNKDVVEFNM